MSTTAPPQQNHPAPWTWGHRLVFIIPFSIMAYVVIGAIWGNAGLDATTSLFFGWLGFLLNSAPRMRPDWALAGVAGAAVLVLAAAVDRLGRQATRRWATAGRWTVRSTIAATLAVLVLFAAGTAVIGATHQVLWLATVAPPAPDASARWGRESVSLIAFLRRDAQRIQSWNQLKMLTMAVHNYHDAYQQFPVGAVIDDHGRAVRGWVPSLSGWSRWSIRDYAAHEPWDGPHNRQYGLGALPDLVHPALGWHGQFDERGFALMHYAGNVHVFPNNRGFRLSDCTDGTSQTLAIGEVAENFQPWLSPYNRRDPADGVNAVPWGFGGPPWQYGAYFSMVDGSVRFVSRDIDRTLLTALGTPAGGEGTTGDW